MSGLITPEVALQRVPGWGSANITVLDGGLSNRTFKVTADGRSAVLKINAEPRQEPFNTLSAEADIQNLAADAGLAARVLHADEGVYFTEFLEGDVWSATDFAVPENLERLAAALKRLHALPLTGRTFDAAGAAQRYAETSGLLDRELTENCVRLITGMQLTNKLCCCHNDVVAENLISTPELRFIDWEYACDNDPLFDLATVVEHHDFSEEQTTTLLGAYFQSNGDAWHSQFKEQRKLYLALLWLWMAARPDSSSHELASVATRLKSIRQ